MNPLAIAGEAFTFDVSALTARKIFSILTSILGGVKA